MEGREEGRKEGRKEIYVKERYFLSWLLADPFVTFSWPTCHKNRTVRVYVDVHYAQLDVWMALVSSLLSCSVSDSASELDPELAKSISCIICLTSLTISGKGFVRGKISAASLLLYSLPLRPP